MNKNFIYIGFFLLVLAASLWFFRPKEYFLTTDCNPTKSACVINQKGVSLKFDLSPRPLNPTTPFKIDLAIKGVSLKNAKVFLIGQNFTHDTVILDLKQTGDGLFMAKSDFPFCTEKLMKWRAHIVAKGKGSLLKTNFDFEVSRNAK